jgi:hypothetical protein
MPGKLDMQIHEAGKQALYTSTRVGNSSVSRNVSPQWELLNFHLGLTRILVL